jgi:N-acetylglucosaminyl-diphospho-decaprenol L-rhamnosyltransferase
MIGVVPASVDVVVLAYNRYELTQSCLRHLRAQTLEHNVIVVDNGSTDDTRARIRSDWPEVQLVCFDNNQSFPKACNRGVAAGSGEFVVLLNNDIDCRSDYVERLVSPLMRDPAVGSVSALLLQPDNGLIDSIGFTVDVTLAAFSRLQGLPPSDADRSLPRLLGPGGGAAAYRRSAWEQVQGLDETLLFYMEDVDLALRLRLAGWRAVAEPRAVALHLRSGTLGAAPAAQRRYGGFGRGYILRRYGLLRRRNAPRTAFTELVVVLGDIVISRDLASLRGRIAGWRAARARPRLGFPPPDAVDPSIGFADSLARRWRVHELQTG